MLVSSSIRNGHAEVTLLQRRLTVTDVDRLHRTLAHFLCRQDVATVTLDLRRMDFVDNSFLNMLRSLAHEARRARRRLKLRSAPVLLRYLLSSPSHRLAWAMGLVPLEASSPAGRLRARRERIAAAE